MTDTRLAEAFASQSRACASLGSPFMGRLMALFAERYTRDMPLGARLFDWPGDVSSRGHSLPLRMAGALHALRLQGDAGLDRVYPPMEVADDDLWAAVLDALRRETAAIDAFIDSPPQTNEVRRAAVLIAAGNWLAGRYGLPLRLSEMGASAGLNLMWDRFALETPEGRIGPEGAMTLRPEMRGATPAPGPVEVVEREGVDLNPLDPVADALRLTAYLWPDQPERLALTRAAIDMAEARVERSDAADWVESRLAPRPGTCHMVYSTIAFQYFPPDTQARITAAMERAGAAATADTPLAWVWMEADERPDGAGIGARLWPGDEHVDLGRIDFHGRWLDWRAP